MAAVQTMRVKDGNGVKVINAADYDEKQHGKPIEAKPAKKPAKKQAK
jgi:hypothetical protein